jgi:hypothetical protein
MGQLDQLACRTADLASSSVAALAVELKTARLASLAKVFCTF